MKGMGCGCRPKCRRRCIGVFTTKYKVYENCCYSVYKICPCCGHEYDFKRNNGCPRCGGIAADPPRFGGRFGNFGRFGGREFGEGRFGRLGWFGEFGFFPFEEEEEEEEFF